MANEIKPAGYEDLRDQVAARWDSFSLRYDGGELLPISLGDPRITPAESGKDVLFTLRLQLTDDDVAALPEPRTIDEALLIAPGGEVVSGDTFEPATIDEDEPELVITYRIRLPTDGLRGPPGRGIHVFEQDPGGAAAAGDVWITR